MKNKGLWQADKLYFCSYLLCIILIAVFLGLQRIYISDYSTVNGDFQTYNIIRRVLDGQVSYSEFTNYLGLGIVLINAPLVALNNLFTTSLFVTNAATGLCFALAVTLLLFLVTGHKYYSWFGGVLLTLFAIFSMRYCELFTWYTGLNLYEPGNSMRMQRAFLAFLLAFLFYYLIEKKKVGLAVFADSNSAAVATGLIVGLATAWSTDFGLSCLLSSFIIYLGLWLRWSAKVEFSLIIKPVLFLLATAAGFLIQTLITTRGDLPAYLDFARGVAAYQYWYYGINVNKYLSVLDVVGNKTYMAFIVLFVLITVYYLRKLLKGSITAADLAAYFIGLNAFLASLIYLYGSSWMAYEVFRLTTIIILAGLIMRRVSVFARERHKTALTKICQAGIFLTLAVSVFLTVSAAAQLTTDRGVPYVEELGGYTTFAEGLFKTRDYIGNEEVFSTYALALEVMTGQFQPTGSDYIIHVLGDPQRQAYIDHFRQGHYRYVTTSYIEYQPFEAWSKRSNWFFYRELLKYYQPSFNTDYLVMWEPAELEKITAEVSPEVIKINTYTYEIRLQSNFREPFIADVIIYYQARPVSNLYRFQTLRRVIAVTDESMAAENHEKWNTYFIPATADSYNLPICLRNGTGKIMLTSLPVQCTELEITGLQIIDLLPDYYYSVVARD